MTDKRNRLISTALCILGVEPFIHADEVIAQAPKKKNSTVQCFGINNTRGVNGCAVTQEQINLANKVYSNAYKSSKIFDCAGLSECAAKSGHLAWIIKDNQGECFKSNGFVFKQGTDGKMYIETKEGKKS